MKRPNILLFNPDQWRSDVMGVHGNPAASTPFLDRLVQSDAVSFRNAFCQNPVCTPSRCSFMSGWYPHVHGHRTMFHMLHHELGQPTMLRTLRENGYFVWWGGKNDLVPGQGGFEGDCDIKFRPDADFLRRHGKTAVERDSHWNDKRWRGERGTDGFFSFYRGKLTPTEGGDGYLDGDWAHVLGAIDFIRDYQGDKPFCLYLPLGYPHPPYAVEEPFFSRIDRSKLPPRKTAPQEGEPMLLTGIRENQGLTHWTEDRWNELRATYYGMCARLDRQLEMVVDALRERGLYDDTAIFLFSDHGDFTGDYGLVEKSQNTFADCLVNVPLVFKPPKAYEVQPGVRQALAELVDVSETVFELAGVDPGYDRFGKSLLPLLSGAFDEFRDAVFCEGGRRLGETQAMELESPAAHDVDNLYYPRLQLQKSDEKPWHGKAVMCRTRAEKYVYRLYERDEFYDLVNDPGETHNEIDNPAYRERILELRERTLRWLFETADVVPRKTDAR